MFRAVPQLKQTGCLFIFDMNKKYKRAPTYKSIKMDIMCTKINLNLDLEK